jgi:hypothetical protein
MLRPATICFLTLLAPMAHGAISHCGPDEDVVFSCMIEQSATVASVCASRDLLKHRRGYVAYRFGEAGKIEYEYPAVRENSRYRFRYFHYSFPRPREYRDSLRFQHGGRDYRIHYHYLQSSFQVDTTIAGVSITTGELMDAVELKCGGEMEFGWDFIDGAIPCAQDSPRCRFSDQP